MSEPLWQTAKRFNIPANAQNGFWTRVLDYVDAGQWLKFVVDDVLTAPLSAITSAPAAPLRPPQWSYAPDLNCTADGDPVGPLNPATCLVSSAAPGALVAKVGGSCAGRADDGRVFVIGSFCLVALDATTRGTLYLAMNVDPTRPMARTGSVEVNVSLGR
jgi:hypothetical protein